MRWTNEKRKVKDLKEWPRNPRRLTKDGLARLEQSIASVGYIEPIAINTDGTIIGGHGRKQALLKLKIDEVDVRVPERELTEKEIEEANIRLNKNIAGEFNFDALANDFEIDDLLEWGFEEYELGVNAESEEEGGHKDMKESMKLTDVVCPKCDAEFQVDEKGKATFVSKGD